MTQTLKEILEQTVPPLDVGVGSLVTITKEDIDSDHANACAPWRVRFSALCSGLDYLRFRWTPALAVWIAKHEQDAASFLSKKFGLAPTNLEGANLTRANLYGANLYGAYLAGANLTGANLAGANLADANLTGANLTRADLTRANLAGAYLAGANLTGANLAGAYLYGANLEGARASVAPSPDWVLNAEGFLMRSA